MLHFPLTISVLLACSAPASGPLSNATRTSTSPFCPGGTPTEAGQNVPQANPEVVEARALPSAPANDTRAWQPSSKGPEANAPR